MLPFADFYLSEKTINVQHPTKELQPNDQECVDIGQKLADRFGLILNGWQEMAYVFTIPAGVPNEKNTFTAKSEIDLVGKLKERFPQYFDYILQKNFPNGYSTDPTIPSSPAPECEPLDMAGFRASLAKSIKGN